MDRGFFLACTCGGFVRFFNEQRFNLSFRATCIRSFWGSAIDAYPSVPFVDCRGIDSTMSQPRPICGLVRWEYESASKGLNVKRENSG
ncbi:hypothetical protein AVEN_46190-1 [Araneus ventricosus]|uniref:Uncharacterized protein n=1 Tax=Araneus ventricosus TaxID=182803 RepID=A0A4Y2E702_ARAVE|nr:hypothetical protein AVEN_46190-1 [Araneus ventricosus]